VANRNATRRRRLSPLHFVACFTSPSLHAVQAPRAHSFLCPACAFLFVSAIIPGFSLGSDYSDFICFERDGTDILICEFLVVFFSFFGGVFACCWEIYKTTEEKLR